MGLFSSAGTVFFLCGCGTVLMLYMTYVQHSKLEDSRFKAFCDVDEVITCSKAIAENRDFVELLKWVYQQVGVTYNKWLDPQQPLFRISFFPTLCLLGCLPLSFSQFVASSITSVSSMIAAYLLYMQFQIHNQICLPCVASYFVHILLFLVFVLRWSASGRPSGSSASSSSRTSGGSVSSGTKTTATTTGGGTQKNKTSEKTLPQKSATKPRESGEEMMENVDRQTGVSKGKKEEGAGETSVPASKKSTRKRKANN